MTKKFWCHYIGNDGNTPKRRNIELTDISQLLPNISNEGAKTPVWFETELDDRQEAIYFMYAQLSDKVAVFITRSGIHQRDIPLLLMSDEQIEAMHRERMEKYFADYPAMSEERKAREKEYYDMYAEEDKMKRDKYLNGLRGLQDYESHLLSGYRWISIADIRAFEEVQSPYLPVLQELRRKKLAEQERIEQQRREERRRKDEEEARKKAEAQAKDDAKIQKLVDLGLLPDNLTRMQRGTVLAGLEERGRFKVAEDKTVACTVYELITEHGFNQISKDTQEYNRYGDRLAKPRNTYCMMNDTLDYGFQVNGRMGALMIEKK